MADSSQFSSTISPTDKRYDVFLSFRGEDTRNQFTTYLDEALHEKQILSFMDHKLQRGDEISPTLRKAIENSMISVVILSENYATSTWCLDELVHILDCKKRNGQVVMPIFYGVDPSAVRKQQGSYGVALAQLEKRFKNMKALKVLQWRTALTEVANLSGLDSMDFRPENKLIQKIVQDILLKLPKYSWNIDHCKGRLFAIQERMERIENLLDVGSMDVHIVGIWGIGGIGKTTLASAVFQKFSHSHFEGCTYLWNVRQEYECFGANNLRKKLLADLFKDEADIVNMDTPFVASPVIQDRLCRKKVLIILDDVDTSLQLETLVEGFQLAPGSRIIITTRNKQVLVKVADELIYKVEGLNNIESLKLFHLHAFGKNAFPTEYEALSERVATYANGNPLALKVLGSFLHSRSIEEWESALEKLKKVPNKEILKVLRISYEGLDDKMIQDIFLDIACFFDHSFTREYLESMLDGGDSFTKIGISVLLDKCLIEVCRDQDENKEPGNHVRLWDANGAKNKLCMHDLVRQMGRSIVSDECKEPGNRSRLWDAKDVCHVLEKNKGTEAIEGMVLNMSEIKREIKLSPATFSRMHNLRFLKIFSDKVDNNECKFYIPRRLESLASHELRCFHWDFYPLKSLPSDFAPENLVELILRHSNLKQLGNHEVQSLPKLKYLDLSNSKLLNQVADLSQAPNLEGLNLEGCTSLFKILSSLQNLHMLTSLNLNGCTNLEDLHETSGRSGYLELLKRGDIKNLLNKVSQLIKCSITNFVNNFPVFGSFPYSICSKFPMNLTSLHLSGTTIEEVPSSICCLQGLVHLDLRDCIELKSLPTNICKLKSLESIICEGCSSLEEFPEILEPMECLAKLDLMGAAIKTLPESIENLLELTELYLDNCFHMEFLPKNLSNLSRLDAITLEGCSKLQILPPCPLGLKFISLQNCKSLKVITELSSCLEYFDASNCTSLETILGCTSSLTFDKPDGLMIFGKFILRNCSKLDSNSRNNFLANGVAFSRMLQELLWTSVRIDKHIVDDHFQGCSPGGEIPNQFSNQGCGNVLKLDLDPNWNRNDLLGVVFCVAVDGSKIDSEKWYQIRWEILDGDFHAYSHCMDIGKLYKMDSDHVLTWYTTKHVNGRNWLSTCSDVTQVSFHDMGSDQYCKVIKKCGMRLVYMNDLEQFADVNPNDDKCYEPSERGVAPTL